MKRREFIAALGGGFLTTLFTANAQAGVAHRVAELLTGTWAFVSSVYTRPDGSTFDRWGPEAKGTFIFDGRGNFAQILMSQDSRLFGAKSFSSFGTYSIDETGKVIVITIKGSSNSKLIGNIQRRTILSLTEGELKYLNPLTVSGMKVEAVWKRLK